MPADKNVILKLRGHFVDIMCDINGEYRQYFRYEQGKSLILEGTKGNIRMYLIGTAMVQFVHSNFEIRGIYIKRIR